MTLGKIHPDEAVIDDTFFAAYVAYLGHPVMKCLTGSSETRWIFLIPECDFEIMREEFASAETNLFVKPFISSVKAMWNLQKRARQSLGEYISRDWREIIARRHDV
jgi:hypothetical protein